MAVILAQVSGLVATAVIIAVMIAYLIAHRLELSLAADEWKSRPRMSDSEFLFGCDVPHDAFAEKVAIAARRAIASLATVPPETILPTHSFAKDLSRLPYWDSLDWLGFIFEVEKQSGYGVKIPGSPERQALRAAGDFKNLKVHHMVHAVVEEARAAPTKA